ncbi:hypothetical protein ABIC53_002722 [Microbacterium sp. 1262]
MDDAIPIDLDTWPRRRHFDLRELFADVAWLAA